MITKVLFGKPYKTDAITAQVPEAAEAARFRVTAGERSLTFTCPLGPEDAVYGLGETMGPVNKRGGRYISFNTDTAEHEDTNPSLYASHNFLAVDGERPFGVFFDTPSRVVFEIDYNRSGVIRVVCETADLTLYQIESGSVWEVCRELLAAVGPCYLPPLWAFGYGQSRFGYETPEDFRKVADGYRQNHIPLDYICMDIDYMDGYRDFSFNKKHFSDIAAFVREMRGRGVRLVPIVDAGIKIEPGDPVYEEGVRNGYFCRNKDGGFFRAAVWPGMTHFPDFLNTMARAWFGGLYRFYTDAGIEGFWNDMNEPAIFYSEYSKGPKSVPLRLLMSLLPGDRRKEKQRKALLRDYKSFYHDMDGRRARHYDVHNLFGAMMTRATGEGLTKLLDHRYMLFSRSSYIGAGRYGGVWTGDNTSKWEHLRLNVRHMPSLNMCGFLFSGADTGGFNGNCTRELLLRWLAFSAFTPLMRNHTGKFTRAQEAYEFGDTEAFRRIIGLRYRLLPYIYSEYMKAALRSDLYIKPLAFVYPGTGDMEDQLLVGDSLMIAPVVEEGAAGRRVCLPEAMTMVRYDGEFHCQPVDAGWTEVKAAVDEVVFFIRRGKLLPVGKQIESTAEYDPEHLTLLGDGETYELYADDGLTRACGEENIRVLRKE